MKTVRIRLGIRHGLPVFKNAAIFIVHLPEDQAIAAETAVVKLRTALILSDQMAVADRIVFERS